MRIGFSLPNSARPVTGTSAPGHPDVPVHEPGLRRDDNPALIVAGDQDQSPLSVRGPDWWTDACRLSPGEKSLLTLSGAEHSLGGVHAYGSVPQTTAENPALPALAPVGGDGSRQPAGSFGRARHPPLHPAEKADAGGETPWLGRHHAAGQAARSTGPGPLPAGRIPRLTNCAAGGLRRHEMTVPLSPAGLALPEQAGLRLRPRQ
jgi:hypothetical protein